MRLRASSEEVKGEVIQLFTLCSLFACFEYLEISV